MDAFSSNILKENGEMSENDKTFREMLVCEILENSKPCAYSSYACSMPRVDGHDYCMRHILLDTRGHYKQCCYMYPKGKQCPNGVLKCEKNKQPITSRFCYEHSRQRQAAQMRASVDKVHCPATNEALLKNLVHHLDVPEKKEQVNLKAEESFYAEFAKPKAMVNPEDEEEIDVVSPDDEYNNVESPFVSYQNINDSSIVAVKSKKRDNLEEYASDGNSDLKEQPTLKNTALADELHDSECESAESEEDSPMTHAGIFTAQEVIGTTISNMKHLCDLYKGQTDRLNYLYKQSHHRYLHDLRVERQTHCSIHRQAKKRPNDRTQYTKLKALTSYRRRHGTDAVLHHKYKVKRRESTGLDGGTVTKCSYSKNNWICYNPALPCTKHCTEHIMADSNQVLFSTCDGAKNGVVCQTPIIPYTATTCELHKEIPEMREYENKAKEPISYDFKFKDLPRYKTFSYNY